MSTFGNSVFELIAQFMGRQNTIPVPVPFVRLLGDYEAAAFLSQIIYWSDRTHDAEGWFHKTHDEWREELVLTPKQIRRCTSTCGALIEVKRKGVPARNFYRPVRENIAQALQELAESEGISQKLPKVTSEGDQREHPDVTKGHNKKRPKGTASSTPKGTASRSREGTSNTEPTSEPTSEKKKEGGSALQAEHLPTQPTASSSSQEASPEPDELLDALLDESGGGQAEGITDQPASEAPPRTPDLSELITGEGGQQEIQAASGEEVPAAGGAAAAPADPAEMERAVNLEINSLLTNRWLRPWGGANGEKQLPLIGERPKGIDRKLAAKLLTLDSLSEMSRTAQMKVRERERERESNSALQPLQYATALLRLLDELVAQHIASNLPPETAADLRVSGVSEWQVNDLVVYAQEPHKIVEITPTRITVALLSDLSITSNIIRSGMSSKTLRPYARRNAG